LKRAALFKVLIISTETGRQGRTYWTAPPSFFLNNQKRVVYITGAALTEPLNVVKPQIPPNL